MDVLITSSNYEVVSSGLVTSFEGNPLIIGLKNPNGSFFKIEFIFLKDESIKDQKLDAVGKQDSVTFYLTNFENPLGCGTSKPIHFATDGNQKKLLINFYVYVVGNSNPTLQYTIYREK